MHTPLTTLAHVPPGGTGSIVGEKELPPPGVSAFSVAEGEAELDDVDDVVDGASFSVVGLQAVSVPTATSAVPPATSAIRRLRRPESMISPFR